MSPPLTAVCGSTSSRKHSLMNRLVLFATLFFLSNGMLSNGLLPMSLDAADWQPKRARS